MADSYVKSIMVLPIDRQAPFLAQGRLAAHQINHSEGLTAISNTISQSKFPYIPCGKYLEFFRLLFCSGQIAVYLTGYNLSLSYELWHALF